MWCAITATTFTQPTAAQGNRDLTWQQRVANAQIALRFSKYPEVVTALQRLVTQQPDIALHDTTLISRVFEVGDAYLRDALTRRLPAIVAAAYEKGDTLTDAFLQTPTQSGGGYDPLLSFAWLHLLAGAYHDTGVVSNRDALVTNIIEAVASTNRSVRDLFIGLFLLEDAGQLQPVLDLLASIPDNPEPTLAVAVINRLGLLSRLNARAIPALRRTTTAQSSWLDFFKAVQKKTESILTGRIDSVFGEGSTEAILTGASRTPMVRQPGPLSLRSRSAHKLLILLLHDATDAKSVQKILKWIVDGGAALPLSGEVTLDMPQTSDETLVTINGADRQRALAAGLQRIFSVWSILHQTPDQHPLRDWVNRFASGAANQSISDLRAYAARQMRTLAALEGFLASGKITSFMEKWLQRFDESFNFGLEPERFTPEMLSRIAARAEALNALHSWLVLMIVERRSTSTTPFDGEMAADLATTRRALRNLVHFYRSHGSRSTASAAAYGMIADALIDLGTTVNRFDAHPATQKVLLRVEETAGVLDFLDAVLDRSFAFSALPTDVDGRETPYVGSDLLRQLTELHHHNFQQRFLIVRTHRGNAIGLAPFSSNAFINGTGTALGLWPTLRPCSEIVRRLMLGLLLQKVELHKATTGDGEQPSVNHVVDFSPTARRGATASGVVLLRVPVKLPSLINGITASGAPQPDLTTEAVMVYRNGRQLAKYPELTLRPTLFYRIINRLEPSRGERSLTPEAFVARLQGRHTKVVVDMRRDPNAENIPETLRRDSLKHYLQQFGIDYLTKSGLSWRARSTTEIERDPQRDWAQGVADLVGLVAQYGHGITLITSERTEDQKTHVGRIIAKVDDNLATMAEGPDDLRRLTQNARMIGELLLIATPDFSARHHDIFPNELERRNAFSLAMHLARTLIDDPDLPVETRRKLKARFDEAKSRADADPAVAESYLNTALLRQSRVGVIMRRFGMETWLRGYTDFAVEHLPHRARIGPLSLGFSALRSLKPAW